MLKLFRVGFRTVYITAYLLTGSNLVPVLRRLINIDIFISILLARQVFKTYKTCIINDKIAIQFLSELMENIIGWSCGFWLSWRSTTIPHNVKSVITYTHALAQYL